MGIINLAPIDYENLGRLQKLALFMIVIGPESASVLLRFFDDSDIEMMCREIAKYNIVEKEIQIKVLDEFSEIIGESIGAVLGGANFAQEAVEKAIGDYKAVNILGRISPTGNSSEVIAEFSEMEPRQIFNLVREEQPQTIAFVISHLSLEKATSLMAMLPEEKREEVIERIGSMEPTSLEHVSKVVGCLKLHFSSTKKPTMHLSGGVRTVADLMNLMDREVSKDLLDKIEEKNPELGTSIRRKMFGFEDLVRLEQTDLQRIAREIEMTDLVVAMKSANAALQEAIYNSVSKRAAETLREEISMLGPTRLKEVEAAQDRIIQVVRKLEEDGEITIEMGSSDGVIL